MNIDALFSAAEHAEQAARDIRCVIARLQSTCAHTVCTDAGLDADDFALELCTVCRLSLAKGARRVSVPKPTF